jgi:transcription elongation GreA/GreB family factor
MIATNTENTIIAKEDFDIIRTYLNTKKELVRDEKSAYLLSRLESASVCSEDEFPWDGVRLNTKVILRDKLARLNYTYTVVLPEEADHRKCKVSLFSSIGSAIFGYRRGDDINWQTPKGKRYFTIMAVSQLTK